MNYEKIGEFISEKRKEKNLTQLELAKKIGVTDKAVSKWERGLGCPDISILEVLAKELDVSVLELLKGRKIENEVIKVTEADDYIKESFKVSKDITKNKFLNIISQVLFYLVLFISVAFVCLNVRNYMRLSHKENLYITEHYYERFDKALNKTKENIETIKNNKGILTDEEQQALVKDLEELVDYYENDFIIMNLKDEKYTINEIVLSFINDTQSPKYPQNLLMDITNTFKNHNMKTDYVSKALLSALSRRSSVEGLLMNEYFDRLNYFKFKSSNSLEEYEMDPIGDRDMLIMCMIGIMSVNTQAIETFNLITETLIEAGE